MYVRIWLEKLPRTTENVDTGPATTRSPSYLFLVMEVNFSSTEAKGVSRNKCGSKVELLRSTWLTWARIYNPTYSSFNAQVIVSENPLKLNPTHARSD